MHALVAATPHLTVDRLQDQLARDGIDIEISVSDEGRGIASEQLPHLFRKYADVARGDREPARFGLGLVICKGLERNPINLDHIRRP